MAEYCRFLVVFLTVVSVVINQEPLFINPDVKHVRVSEESAEGATIYTIEFSRSLTSSETVEQVVLIGTNSEYFVVNQDTLKVSIAAEIQPGRYYFDVTVGINNNILIGAVVVDIISDERTACNNQAFGKCSHQCTPNNNTKYGYTCSCLSGFILQIDGFTCLANDPPPELLISHSGGVSHLNLLSRRITSVLNQTNISAFDYNYGKKVLYFVDNINRMFIEVSLDHNVENEILVFQQDIGTITSIIVDWIEDCLYYADVTNGLIGKLYKETGMKETLVTANNPRSMVMHGESSERMLYWVENMRVIKAASVDGSNLKSFTESTTDILSLSLDQARSTLYWVTNAGTIVKMKLDSTHDAIVFESLSEVPISLAIFEDSLYTLLNSSNCIKKKGIFAQSEDMDITYPLNENILHDSSIKIYHSLLQPSAIKGAVDCRINNGGCAHLCVVSAGGFKCQCRSGFRLGSDSVSCFPDEVFSFIISAQHSDTYFTVFQTTLEGQLQSVLVDTSFGPSLQPRTGAIYGMDYDQNSGRLYFADRGENSIWRVPLDRLTPASDDREIFVENITAWDVAVDWINGYLYWTDDRFGIIQRKKVDATMSNVENVHFGLLNPRGIAVDPFAEYVYWAEAGGGRISRAHLSGSVVEYIVTALTAPSAICINLLTNHLYWSDNNIKIESSTLNGTSRTTLVENEAVFQIASAGNYLLWTSGQGASFKFQNLDEPTSISSVLIDNSVEQNILYGLIAMTARQRISLGMAVCISNNLQCSHICKVDENDTPSCGCPTDYTMVDNNCHYSGTCPSCLNGGICLHDKDTLDCSCEPPFAGKSCETSYNSNCFDCSSFHNSSKSVLRHDDGDLLILQANSTYCSAIRGYCYNPTPGSDVCTGCHCEYRLTYRNDRQLCEDYYSVCSFRFSRQGLGVDTSVSTMYFTTTTNGSIFLYSAATNDELPIVHALSNIDISSSCKIAYLQALTASSWVNISHSGVILEESNGNIYVKINADFYYSPYQFEGIVLQLILECPNMAYGCLPFKIQGKSNFSPAGCLNCSGNFKHLQFLDVPKFPMPLTNDVPIHSSLYSLQANQQDVNGCNEVDVFYWSEEHCEMTLLPDNIFYVTQNHINARNLHSKVWELVKGKLVYLSVRCQFDITFCLLFSISENNYIDSCDVSPCLNEGNCTAHDGTFSCTCSNGTIQPYCEIDPCLSNPCTNAGTCISAGSAHYCVCPPFLTGTNCSIQIPCYSSPCQNGGTCTAVGAHFFCECMPEHTGNDCSINITECNSNICYNGGTCIIEASTETCECPAGYTGNLCSEEIDNCFSNPCHNEGTCINAINAYICQCSEGFTSNDCSEDINECISSPCPNESSCIDLVGKYACLCSSGFTGEYCNEDIDECLEASACENGGLCNNTDGSYFCSCLDGYIGTTCSQACDPGTFGTGCTEICACANDASCSNIDGSCICPEGYTGNICSEHSCDVSPCLNEGNCTAHNGTFSCTCPNGTIQPYCEIDPCLLNPCTNAGTCISAGSAHYCVCPPFLTGTNCSIQIPCYSSPCQNGGTCTAVGAHFFCECMPEHTGNDCSINITECNSNICHNGGTCIIEASTETCECPAGYTGNFCSEEIDNCFSNPCHNEGTCINAINAYICQCSEGFTSNDCSEDINECISSPCRNESSCIDLVGKYACLCSSGFTGEYCNEDIDECLEASACENGGLCNNTDGSYFCSCLDGYIGTTCSQACDPGTFGTGCTETCACANDASCSNIDGSCICPEGYTGNICSEPVCSNCNNGGTCIAPETCNCPETFDGPSCNLRVCTEDYCLNGGTCSVDFQVTLSCLCPSTTSGPQCQFRDDVFSPQKNDAAVAAGVPSGIVLTILIISVVGFSIFILYRLRKKHKCVPQKGMMYSNTSSEELMSSEGNKKIVDFITNPVYGVCETPRDTSAKISPSNSYMSNTVYNEYNGSSC